MSYDLSFRSRSPHSRLSPDQYRRHFSGRPHYEVQPSQAWYSNEDSGVYFAFNIEEPGDDAGTPGGSDPLLIPVGFNLNYVRPHAFGLEAEPEVAAFVRKFDLTVSDPQLSGMGDAEYSAEGFLRGWNTGNASAYRTLFTHYPEQRLLSLPSSEIETLWRWNFELEARQNEIGEGAFVPLIFFLDVGGEVRTGIVWGDGIPILLPVVDIVAVPREELAPPRRRRSKSDIVVFTWQEIEPVVRRFPHRPGTLDAYELFYEAIPPDIERMIRAKQPSAQVPTAVSFDQVLDRELLEEAGGQRTNG